MLAVPSRLAVTNPVPLVTEAMAPADEFHFAILVTSCMLPSENVPTAVSF